MEGQTDRVPVTGARRALGVVAKVLGASVLALLVVDGVLSVALAPGGWRYSGRIRRPGTAGSRPRCNDCPIRYSGYRWGAGGCECGRLARLK